MLSVSDCFISNGSGKAARVFAKLLWLLWLALRCYAFFRPRVDIAPGGELYLRRWYLTPTGWWYRNRWPGVFLHCFHTSDPDRGFHSHPWYWATSLILRGSYQEERPVLGYDDWPSVYMRRLAPGYTATLTPNDFHRVKLLTPRVWTLFVVGRLHGAEWEFMSDEGERRPHGTETAGD
jgi:hypothetical protein